MQTHNNTVLITGGAIGIGLALAERFLAEGNTVIITGRNLTKFETAKAKLPTLHTVVANMTNASAVEQLAKAYPHVNILINNAAVQFNYAFADSVNSPELIETELRTNLFGPILLTKYMLPQLLAKPHAAIVNLTSGLGFVPKQSAAVYCATKSGLHTFTTALRWQLEASNVKVFEVIPPLVDTAMTAGRGQGKISPEVLVEEFWHGFAIDRFEMPIDRAKQLLLLNRVAPRLAAQRMRYGL